MREVCIKLNTSGHEPFLDYLKAFAILCVLIGHTLPSLDAIGYPFCIGMQVPIFILIQAFHVLKKPVTTFSVKKLFSRIIFPYVLIELLIILLYSIQDKLSYVLIINGLIGGGYGPGSYYPWVYIQIAIILYCVKPLFEKGNLFKQAIFWIALCEGLEVIEYYANLPDFIHRLLAVRYMFLIYLAWIWVKKGIIINKPTILLSVFSGLSIAYFYYGKVNSEPLFFTTGWSYHRWPCYFYISTLLCYFLYEIYVRISQFDIIDRAVKLLAKCSYEIFLVQMAVIAVFPNFNFFLNKNYAFSLWITIVWLVSILGGYWFNKTYYNLLIKYK